MDQLVIYGTETLLIADMFQLAALPVSSTFGSLGLAKHI